MALITLSVAFCLLLVHIAQGQTTAGSIVPILKTDCGKKAFACWNQQKSGINASEANFDFKTACSLYKTFLDCVDSVIKTPTCGKEGEVNQIIEQAANDLNGMCTDKGVALPCAVDVQNCVTDVLAITTAFQSLDINVICPAMSRYFECSGIIKDNQACPARTQSVLDQLDSTLMASSLYAGCDGPCGRLIGLCTGNVTNTLINGDFINISWKKFCQDSVTAESCIYDLGTNPTCKNTEIYNSTSDTHGLVIRNFCVGSKPTPCIELVEFCTTSYKQSYTDDMPPAEKCQVTSKYVECVSKLPCNTDLSDVLAHLRRSIEALETQRNCPYVGSCPDRFTVCSSWQKDISNATVKSAEYCNLVKTANDCYNYVRGDQLCSSQNLTKSDFETVLTTNMTTLCGGCPQQSSVSLLLLTCLLLCTALRLF